MFVKVVRTDIGKEDEEKCSVDSLYECHKVHIHWAHGSEPLYLQLQTNSDESYPGGIHSIIVDWPDPAMIYIMSEEGQTVDKIEHKGSR